MDSSWHSLPVAVLLLVSILKFYVDHSLLVVRNELPWSITCWNLLTTLVLSLAWWGFKKRDCGTVRINLSSQYTSEATPCAVAIAVAQLAQAFALKRNSVCTHAISSAYGLLLSLCIAHGTDMYAGISASKYIETHHFTALGGAILAFHFTSVGEATRGWESTLLEVICWCSSAIMFTQISRVVLVSQRLADSVTGDSDRDNKVSDRTPHGWLSWLIWPVYGASPLITALAQSLGCLLLLLILTPLIYQPSLIFFGINTHGLFIYPPRPIVDPTRNSYLLLLSCVFASLQWVCIVAYATNQTRQKEECFETASSQRAFICSGRNELAVLVHTGICLVGTSAVVFRTEVQQSEDLSLCMYAAIVIILFGLTAYSGRSMYLPSMERIPNHGGRVDWFDYGIPYRTLKKLDIPRPAKESVDRSHSSIVASLLTLCCVLAVTSLLTLIENSGKKNHYPFTSDYLLLANDDLRSAKGSQLGAITSVRFNEGILPLFIEWNIAAGVNHFIICDENDITGPGRPQKSVPSYVSMDRMTQTTVIQYPPELRGLSKAERVRKAQHLGLSKQLIDRFLSLGDGAVEVEKHLGTEMECKARAFHVFARRMFHWTVLLSPEEFIGQSFRTLQAKYETLSLDEIRRIGALVIQRSYMVGPSSHTSALPVHIGDSFYAADRPQRNTPAKMIVHMAKVNELTDENTFTLSESYQGANSDGSIVLPSTLSSQLGKKAFQKDFDGLFDFHYGLGLTYYGLKLSAKVTAEEHGMRASTPSASDSSFKDWIEMNTPPYNNLGKLSKYYSRRVEKTLTGRPCITTIPIKLPFEISESTGRIWSMLSSGYMLDDSGFADHNLMGATEVCNTAAASSDPLISLLKLEGKANECKWQWTQKNISTTC